MPPNDSASCRAGRTDGPIEHSSAPVDLLVGAQPPVPIVVASRKFMASEPERRIQPGLNSTRAGSDRNSCLIRVLPAGSLTSQDFSMVVAWLPASRSAPQVVRHIFPHDASPASPWAWSRCRSRWPSPSPPASPAGRHLLRHRHRVPDLGARRLAISRSADRPARSWSSWLASSPNTA